MRVEEKITQIRSTKIKSMKRQIEKQGKEENRGGNRVNESRTTEMKENREKNREFVRSTKEERGEHKKRNEVHSKAKRKSERQRKRCCGGVDDLVEASSLSPAQQGCCCSCFRVAFLCLPSRPHLLPVQYANYCREGTET